MTDLIERIKEKYLDPEELWLMRTEIIDEIERLQTSLAYNIEALSKADAMNAKLQAVVDAATVLRDRIEPRSKGGIADEYYALVAALEDE